MNIIIMGNGKMGKQIAKLAQQRKHNIIKIADSNNKGELLDIRGADVCIEFSTPETAFKNISHSIKSGIPIISGTTGWLNRMEEIKKIRNTYNGSFLYSENFSIGMNILFELNKKLAYLMKDRSYLEGENDIKDCNYDCTINEIHHKKKIDAPSGTAKKLANNIKDVLMKETSITYERKNDVIGEHNIIYSSKEDLIKITHIAKNRESFAYGAIIAAEWIINKKGIFNFYDVIELPKS